jgi:hypothetical protein
MKKKGITNRGNSGGMIEFDVETVISRIDCIGNDSFSQVIKVPEHVISSSIINYCVQHYGWNKNNVSVKFTERGEMSFIINK